MPLVPLTPAEPPASSASSNGSRESAAPASIASLARLTGARAMLLVRVVDGLPELFAGYPSELAVGMPQSVNAVARSGRGVCKESAIRELTFVEPLMGKGGEVIGAVMAVFAATCRDTATERMVDAVPLAASLLESVAAEGEIRLLTHDLGRIRTRIEELTRTVSGGVATVDMEGRIQEVNSIAAEILRLPTEALIGRDFRDFVAPDDRHHVVDSFAMLLAGDIARHESEIHLIRPDGERRLVHASSSAITDESGIVGVYFVARDVTEERSRERHLRRAERLASLAPLLGGICHELNNPLTSIKSFAELMLLDERPGEDVEALEIVRREAARAAQIVSDLKLVARQTQEDGIVSTVQVNELVDEARSRVASECASIDAQIRLDLDAELPAVQGNKSQLERMIDQLLRNAVQVLADHSGPREITIRTFPTELGVGFRVGDSGPGIAPDHVEQIFDPFWTTRTTGEGPGLGLSLAHSIVTDHGGRISVEGGWGTGAVFTIELPTGEWPAVAEEPAVQAPARLPLRILVVDDEGPIRYTMVRYMTRRGHTVLEAEEGGRALEVLEDPANEPFDIILADLRMPGLGGDKLFARLKERGDGLEQRLIFITGDAESPDAARVVAEAGVPVVLKPFELAEIALIVESHAAALAAA